MDYETLKQGNGIIAAELGNKIKANKGDQRGSIANKDYYNIGLLKCSYTLLGDKYDGLKPRPSKKKNAGDRLF